MRVGQVRLPILSHLCPLSPESVQDILLDLPRVLRLPLVHVLGDFLKVSLQEFHEQFSGHLLHSSDLMQSPPFLQDCFHSGDRKGSDSLVSQIMRVENMVHIYALKICHSVMHSY